MTRIPTLFLVVICVACAVAAQSPLSPPKFVPVNVPGEVFTYVEGINDKGIMVGETSSPGTHGFAIVGSDVITIDVPGANGTSCASINSYGAIVGHYYTKQNSNPRGFLYQNGKFTDIGPGQEFNSAVASGINDFGLIVGSYSPDGVTQLGFSWDGQTYQSLSVPGSTTTMATGVNNAGLITLQWAGSDNLIHSSLYDGTTYTNIDVPGASNTFAFAVNNQGDVAVTWLDASERHRFGALFHSGQYHSFLMQGTNQTEALGVNDNDIVVGISWSKQGDVYSGYKLIP